MNVINSCPVCSAPLSVTEYRCERCNVTIRGNFEQNKIAHLSPEHFEFVRIFLSVHGNIKEVEKKLGISYPTVKSRLEQINRIIGNKPIEQSDSDAGDILDAISEGSLSVDEALKKLRKEG